MTNAAPPSLCDLPWFGTFDQLIDAHTTNLVCEPVFDLPTPRVIPTPSLQKVADLAMPVLAHPVEGVGAEDVDAMDDDGEEQDGDEEERGDDIALGPGAQVWDVEGT